MTEHYRVLIVGGGVVGCNILHHLTLEGWTDIALCERKELTAGATWHSSGHISCYTGSPLLTDFALYTRSQLKPIVEETGQEIGLRETGSLRLAVDDEAYARFEQFPHTPVGESTGARMVNAEESLALWPLMRPGGYVGGLFIPADCHLNAADLTQALSKAARAKGATVKRHTEVQEFSKGAAGEWIIETSKGRITADHIVLATGIFARRTFAKFNISLPSAVVSHQYLVTEPVSEVLDHRSKSDRPLPILRQPSNGMNVREEGEGLFISLYEQNTHAIWPEGPPADFGMELFPEDFDSIEDAFLEAIDRVPCLERAGIKSIVHGPMPWSSDFAPLVGPVPATQGLWVAECASYGVIWSGGIARALARWIVHGDPGQDASEIDCRRFGSYADDAWSDSRAVRMYQGVFGSGKRPAAPLRSSLYDRLEAAGASFDEIYGTDCALRFPDAYDHLSKDACGVGFSGLSALHEPSPRTILRISGQNAADFLAGNLHGAFPLKNGESAVSLRLSPRNTVETVYTVKRVASDEFVLVGETVCERREHDAFIKLASDWEHVTIENDSVAKCCLVLLAGGEICKKVLAALTGLNVLTLPLHDLGGVGRYLLVHSSDIHDDVFDTCLSALGDAGTVNLGIADYSNLRTAYREPVPEVDITGNCYPDGQELLSHRTNSENETAVPRRLASIDFVTDTSGDVYAGASIISKDRNQIGRLTSVVELNTDLSPSGELRSWRATGFVAPDSTTELSGHTVRIGCADASISSFLVIDLVLPEAAEN
ncbi:MAG: FAD-dependent oxidoreductase [Thalassospira sp.]|uniref:FAD-dependent oxidoreductase n=1 Tax=Thalassospira sp. TaxID=1912094 RepID=UPI003A8AA34E